MTENNLLKFSNSPHVKSPRTTKWIMINVCIALLPACIAGCVFFSWKALLVLVLSLVSAVASELVYQLIAKKTFKQFLKEFDFTSCVTGLLVGMCMGSQTPWYAPVLASAFAIIVVKMLFGGTGRNLVNPAITGRIFAFISFTSVMDRGWIAPTISGLFGGSSLNPTTGATVLTNMFDSEFGGMPTLSNLDLFLGKGVAGCIGETCKLALILGGLYLAILGIINIGYPIIYIVITGLFTVLLKGFNFEYFLPSILSGGLFLGAIFMATDYVTTPNTTLGNIIYFVALGLITAGLRVATKIEVVSFAILLMNLIVPLIDKFVMTKPFGFKKKKEAKNG